MRETFQLEVSSKYFHLVLLDKELLFNPLSANPTKWSNTLKQFIGNLPMNCLSVFDHFVELALQGLSKTQILEFLVNFFIFPIIKVQLQRVQS